MIGQEMPGQSTRQLMHRLAEGRCPLHGTPMTEVGPTDDGSMVIVECTQADCNIRGTKSGSDETVVLVPEFLHLLDPDRPEI
jgi:hypothetical protein